jgi:hypothetical protein
MRSKIRPPYCRSVGVIVLAGETSEVRPHPYT